MVYDAWMEIHTRDLIGYFQNPNNLRKHHYGLHALHGQYLILGVTRPITL